MRHLIIAVAVVACLIVMSSVAQACSCGGGGTPCEAYGTASAVFVGTPVSVGQVERPKPEDKDAWFLAREPNAEAITLGVGEKVN